MSYVLVTADFPGVSTEQRNLIYKCLEEKKWIKVKDLTTAWYASFGNDFSEKEAIDTTKSEFKECSKKYCDPKLVIHWGPNKPTFYNLD